MTDKPPAVIFDMDGTLVDTGPFLHHVTGKTRNFDAFHAATCAHGTPHWDVVQMLTREAWAGRRIIIVTGRTAKWHEPTRDWLVRNLIPFHEILGRADGDYRPDTVVKAEILAALRARPLNVLGAWDDRPSVLAMWRAQGIPNVVDVGTWTGPDER